MHIPMTWNKRNESVHTRRRSLRYLGNDLVSPPTHQATHPIFFFSLRIFSPLVITFFSHISISFTFIDFSLNLHVHVKKIVCIEERVHRFILASVYGGTLAERKIACGADSLLL